MERTKFERLNVNKYGGMEMTVFADFLAGIDDLQHRERTKEVLDWISDSYPQLEKVIKWNQPMFTDHGTYIIGFSTAKKHLAVAPERAGMAHCAEEIKAAGYDTTKDIIRIPWTEPVDYSLLAKMVEFNIIDKKEYTSFWR